MIQEPLLALKDLVAAFEKTGVEYFVGGSFASGARGEFRATNDIDVICQITEENVDLVLKEIRAKFIVDERAFKNNLGSPKSYNVLHEETFLKVDLFCHLGEFEKMEFGRASTIVLPGIEFSIRVATAEDIILSKLRWYRQGGEWSERQWSDIRGVRRIQKNSLDEGYLTEWAAKLGVTDLLEKLLKENST